LISDGSLSFKNIMNRMMSENNNSLFRKIWTLVIVFHTMALSAQRVEWVVYPKEGITMAPFCNGLVKVKNNGKVGLMNYKGQMVVKAENDQITDFFNGHAFILQRASGNKVLLSAIVDAKGNVRPMKKEYFIVPRIVFFSEGLMPLADKAGKIGFVDTMGEVVVPFKYSQVLPYSEGHACVWTWSSKNLLIIDKSAEPYDGFLAVCFVDGESLCPMGGCLAMAGVSIRERPSSLMRTTNGLKSIKAGSAARPTSTIGANMISWGV